jgi:hypothetical protein
LIGQTEFSPPDMSATDRELFNVYTAALEKVCSPRASLTDILHSQPPSCPSPFLDELHGQHAGSAPAMSEKIADTVQARDGELPLPLVSAVPRPQHIARLMLQNYPPAFHAFADIEAMRRALARDHAPFLSFLALGSTGQDFEYMAACRAYVGPSNIDPEADKQVVHLNHMIVTSSQRADLLGVRMFRELLGRAEMLGIGIIELLAREETSYKSFRPDSRAASRIFRHQGYHIKNLGIEKKTGEDNMYRIRIEKIDS